MRFETLKLEQFGHFRRARLALPAGPSLVLVHGPNEAGKTTTLEAIRWLLFGGTPSKWAIDVDVAKLAVEARMTFRSGAVVDARRSRGRGGGFRGITQSSEVDEEWIRGKLQNPNRALFENVFGFSLEGLARGAAALADDEVKSTLYGGGLGTVQPDAILAELRKEASEIFRERGAATLKTRLEAVEDLKKQLASKVTKTESFLALERERDERMRLVQTTEDSLAEARRAQRNARERKDAWAHLKRVSEARHELEGLVLPESLPAEASERHTRAVERRDQEEKKLRELAQRIRDAELVLSETPADDEALRVADRADELLRDLSRYESARADRPRKDAEREVLARATAEELSSLRPGWTLDRLRALRVDPERRLALETSVAAHEERVREQARLRGELRELEARLSSQRDALLAPAEGIDVAPLRQWLDRASGDEARRDELKKLDAQLRSATRRRDTARKKLVPPLAPDVDPRSIVTPRPEQLDALVAEIEGVEKRLQHHKDEHDKLGQIVRKHDVELAKLRGETGVPTEHELRRLRLARDEAFTAVLADGSLEAYERARDAADAAADRMRAHADVVQRRKLVEVEWEAAFEDRVEVARRITELAAQLELLRERHRAMFPDLSPLEPRVMRGFLDDLVRWDEADASLEELATPRAQLSAQVLAFAEEGRALLGPGEVDALRAEAQRRIDRETERALEHGTLRRQHEQDTATLGSRLERARVLETELLQLRAEIPEQLQALGLEAELAPAVVGQLLPALLSLRQKWLDRELALEQSQRTDDALVASFEERLGALTEGTARALEARVKTARESERRRAEATRELGRARGEHERVAAEHERTRAELTELRALAGVEDDAAFRKVARDRERADDLQREIELQQQAVQRILGRTPEPAWIAEVLSEGEQSLSFALSRADEVVTSAEKEVRERAEQVGGTKARLSAIDGRADAAELQETIELDRSSIRAEAERWAVLTLADALLRSSIARFERDHQPTLLARASEIFSQMTLGRYPRIRKAGAGLSCDRDDDREVSPEQLSTGTREQLYLAIRLAYIAHYCSNAEPLPVVLDDVLVNFDDERARATLGALAAFGSVTQVLLFTCHASTLRLAREAAIDAVPLEIPRRA